MKKFYLLFLLILLFLIYYPVKAQFVQKVNGLTWTSGMSIDALNDQVCVFSVYPNNLYKTTNGGSSWQSIQQSISNNVVDVSIIDNNHIVAVTLMGEIYITTDGGQTWDLKYKDTSKVNAMNYIKMFDSKNGIVMGDVPVNTKIPAPFLKTTDGGLTWILINKNYLLGCWSGDLWRRLDFINQNTGFFYESGIGPMNLYKTTDGGATWNPTNFPGPYIQIVKFYNENIGLTISDGIVYRTLDGGVTWKNFTIASDVGWGNDIEFFKNNPAKVFFTDYKTPAFNKYLYFSQDTGRTWNRIFSFGTGKTTGRDIVIPDANNCWILTDTTVYLCNNVANLKVTGIDNPKNEFVKKFDLLQNYPNPFNPGTTIEFSLQNDDFVTLKIFDLLGKEITTLISENIPSGKHKYNWNAVNIPGGVYYYCLQTGLFSETKKLILLK
jgi:photosystem II stability/assembly factor-like uncharacterized protein